ncbi:MAG: O-acetylhomoserine aminocarboxypropyltransferase/cysteine synthase family protein [Desulfurivibrionaceae bacterium]
MTEQKRHFDTRVIHDCLHPENWQGSTLPPIYQCASHRHATAENLSDTFGGKTGDHIYMRLTNPTNRTLEEKMASLEGGKAAVAMSSGMAAITNACLALLRAGDEFVTGNSLFMSTFCLFNNVFKKYDITPRFVESTDLNALEAAINERTRFIYLETIGNPKMDVPDLEASAEIAHRYGLPLLVDNTLATPWLCRPFDLGADVVIHSTTKYLSGHGDASGGIVIDRGQFNWDTEKFADFKPFIDRKGALAYIDKVWREFHINFGTTMAPLHSYLTMVGLDTLSVRLERQQKNTLEVARFLKDRPEVKWVNYPGLDDSPFRKTADRQFGGKGFGGVLAFGLADKEACFKFIAELKMIYHLANLGDCKSLVIHPSSSQYLSFAEDTKQELAITDDLVRLSVGIEALEDIRTDIAQALSTL